MFQTFLSLILLCVFNSAHASTSLPLERLAEYCAHASGENVYGLWRVDKEGCSNRTLRKKLSRYLILLPQENSEHLKAYLSDTEDFSQFTQKDAELMSYADTFIRITYPGSLNFYDLVLKISSDGIGHAVYGWKNWKELIPFRGLGGTYIGCPSN